MAVNTPSRARSARSGLPPSLLLRRGAVALLRRYQRRRAGRPAACRYLPTCSTYAIQAVERYGLVEGGMRAIRRILRCRPPFCGVDEP
jgi:uncharacterized protein